MRRSTSSTSSRRTRRSLSTSTASSTASATSSIWDNASLLHSATLVDPDDARTLWRITVLEPAPVGMAPQVIAPTFAHGGM